MLKLALLTVLALFSFAENSVLCRMALTDEVIDAASFTSIRLFSGIVFLLFLVVIKTKEKMTIATGSGLSSLLLFLYAIAFSYAYLTLDTGTGALILFGAVQATMIMSGLLKGRQFLVIEWVGLLLALLGLVALLMPGAAAPSLTGFVLMAGSGIAWAFYTLAGKHSKNPLIDTANNFLRTLPFIAMTMLLTFSEIQISNKGILLAIASGAVMSGLGYAIWYSVLPSLTLTQAAILKLTVPIIAAVGGVLFSNEVITIKLISSSILVLGGVLVVTVGRRYAEVFIKNKPNYN
jgi:drug/metabolite transporter (DMT)-like permease